MGKCFSVGHARDVDEVDPRLAGDLGEPERGPARPAGRRRRGLVDLVEPRAAERGTLIRELAEARRRSCRPASPVAAPRLAARRRAGATRLAAAARRQQAQSQRQQDDGPTDAGPSPRSRPR